MSLLDKCIGADLHESYILAVPYVQASILDAFSSENMGASKPLLKQT